MDWYKCAVEDLKSYVGLKSSLESIPERINALYLRFTSIAGVQTDKIQGSRDPSCRENRMLDNIVEREKLKCLYKANLRMVNIIEHGLNGLDETEKKILECFFIKRKPNHLYLLMDELKLEQSQIYKLKDKALRKFTKNMYGIKE